jgi:DNA-binding transcriptional regulator YiaG
MNSQRQNPKVKKMYSTPQISSRKTFSRLKIVKIREINHLEINEFNAGLMSVPQLMPIRSKTSRPSSKNQKSLKEITLSRSKIKTSLQKLKKLCNLAH